jgi:hypothetical protein
VVVVDASDGDHVDTALEQIGTMRSSRRSPVGSIETSEPL